MAAGASAPSVAESPLVTSPVEPSEQSAPPKAPESANIPAEDFTARNALMQAPTIVANDVGSISFVGDLPDSVADYAPSADSAPISLSAATASESSGNVPLLFHFPSFKS